MIHDSSKDLIIQDDTTYLEVVLRLQNVMLEASRLQDALRAYHLVHVQETQKLGRVRIKYSKGSLLRDYPGTWKKLHPGVEPSTEFLKVPAPTYDYKSALEAEGVADFEIKSYPTPSVEFELLPEK